MKFGFRRRRDSNPPPVAVVEEKPEAYEPTSLPGLLQRIRSRGDRQARRWARDVSRRTSSLSPEKHDRRKKRNTKARKARKRNRT